MRVALRLFTPAHLYQGQWNYPNPNLWIWRSPMIVCLDICVSILNFGLKLWVMTKGIKLQVQVASNQIP